MRGRKPKPTALHQLEGTTNVTRHRDRLTEPQAPGVLVEPPEWLTELQRVAWAYALEHAPVGVLAKIDRACLTVWVIAEDLHRDALAKVQAGGLIVRSPNKGEPMQNPYLAIVNKQALIMLKAAAELGFTPASRPRLGVKPGGGAGRSGNRFADLGPKVDAPGDRTTH